MSPAKRRTWKPTKAQRRINVCPYFRSIRIMCEGPGPACDHGNPAVSREDRCPWYGPRLLPPHESGQ